jgi:hypothetical protein
LSIAVFNINDAGIQLTVDSELVRTSPGIAVLNNNSLLTGEEASKNVKLLPRWTNNRFWSQLNTNPLPNSTEQVRHHADIAFAHLEDLWLPVSKEVENVILIVPGYYHNNDLGLLLGIARECGMPVKGVVDQSVIAASNLPLRSNVIHLDVHLHSFTLTQISNGGILARKDVKTILETGLSTLWDRWANIIASQFIQTTRFDPMHNADTEQQLFNLLPGWIKNLQDSNMHSFSFNAAGTEHSVAISQENLLKACTPLYPQIVQAIRNEIVGNEPASLLLSHRLQGFPGLKESLRLVSNLEVIDLPEEKANDSAATHNARIIGDGGTVSHVVQLGTGEVAVPPKQETRPSGATHILWRHQATAIGKALPIDADLSEGPRFSNDPAFTLYSRNNQIMIECGATDTVKVNGSAVDPDRPMKTGDQIELAGDQLTLISVPQDG